ncbi:helix-turn-helix transcriptional regulator [Nonomuraea sp. NPDC046570]|uniref:helix-turn-helix domain-containing protein n=1 Tax=Nonomuraea sp. NPDC046570 TaxID=3155255 RepID=UPI00340FFA38
MHNEPDQISPRAQFAADLQQFRKDRGLSQVALSGHMKVHQSLVSHVERGVRPPTRDFAEAADRAFGLEGHFAHLYARVVQSPALGWFARWVEEVEPRATMLWTWDPLLVPGLLQTDSYARAIFSTSVIPVDQAEERVVARMQRRHILDRADPPLVWALIDEGVLHRPIGGVEVLAGQLRYLLELAKHPRLMVQIVPVAAGCASGMVSSFALARLPSGAEAVTIDSLLIGQVTADPQSVGVLRARYETIRASAHSKDESRRVIENAVSKYESGCVA